MPDVAMCGDAACPMRVSCYRSPDSGTVPNALWQSWQNFPRAMDEDRCSAFWPLNDAHDA